MFARLTAALCRICRDMRLNLLMAHLVGICISGAGCHQSPLCVSQACLSYFFAMQRKGNWLRQNLAILLLSFRDR